MLRKTLLPAVALVCAVGACSPDSGGGEASTHASRSSRPGASAAPKPPDPDALTGNGTSGLPPALARALDDEPVEASSASQVVDQIVAAERAIADPRTKPAVLDAAGRLQQVAYRELGTRSSQPGRVPSTR